MKGTRALLITADDFGIGIETSRGILDLAAQGSVTGTVLLVNSPHAEASVQLWRRAGQPLELGWHPNLTLDRPVLPVAQVSSLVDAAGRFWPLGSFLRRLCQGHLRPTEIEAELRAQYTRFRELVGNLPRLINTHHHVQIFHPVGTILLALLRHQQPLPYLRRVGEPLRTLLAIPGARLKRALLSIVGRSLASRQETAGFPGNDWLAGVTDPPFVADPAFLYRWLTRMPGAIVELTCHPGYLDTSLIGRDCTADDGQVQRRVQELHLLRQASFPRACRRAHFTLLAAQQLGRTVAQRRAHAA